MEMESESGKLGTPCWNGQSFLGNSEWLVENVKGIDQSVEEMLQLIEHSGDSELIARLKEICHRHHLLADHYNKLNEELSSQSKLAKENEKRAFDSQLTPPFLTPMNKPRMQDAGSDLSSGGGLSDITPNRGSESSLSSDSDSETPFMSPNERLSSAPSEKMVKRGIVHMGVVEISDYEKELDVCNGKLISAEEEIVKLKMELKNNDDTVMVKLGNLEAELLSAKNHIKLHESEMEKENERSLMLQRGINDLEAELLTSKNHIKMQESEMEKENERSLMLQRKIVDIEAKLELERKKQVQELSDRDNRIQKLSAELQDVSGSFALEKWQLESTVSELSEKLSFQKAKAEALQAQCDSLADEKNISETEKIKLGANLEALKITWRDDIERLMVELSEKSTLLDTSNQNLDGMKLKYNTVMAEKDGVHAKLEPLLAEISCLKQNLHELNSEKNRLSALSDSGNKLTGELESRIVELEKEVGILGEEKREAIRQLCFAIDHFRCAYKKLKNARKVNI